MLQVGSLVSLNVPENPRLHNSTASILHLTDWGAHVLVSSSATGYFRALFEEMVELDEPLQTIEQQQSVKQSINGQELKESIDSSPAVKKRRSQGYTGNICMQCGGARMVRNGTCELCQDCGSTSGCS